MQPREAADAASCVCSRLDVLSPAGPAAGPAGDDRGRRVPATRTGTRLQAYIWTRHVTRVWPKQCTPTLRATRTGTRRTTLPHQTQAMSQRVVAAFTASDAKCDMSVSDPGSDAAPGSGDPAPRTIAAIDYRRYRHNRLFGLHAMDYKV